ncbi:MAG: hypothetical protein FD129_1593 [bacterium]|nr:MAG: hypothetical protein FD129_1593 [bacterium]
MGWEEGSRPLGIRLPWRRAEENRAREGLQVVRLPASYAGRLPVRPVQLPGPGHPEVDLVSIGQLPGESTGLVGIGRQAKAEVDRGKPTRFDDQQDTVAQDRIEHVPDATMTRLWREERRRPLAGEPTADESAPVRFIPPLLPARHRVKQLGKILPVAAGTAMGQEEPLLRMDRRLQKEPGEDGMRRMGGGAVQDDFDQGTYLDGAGPVGEVSQREPAHFHVEARRDEDPGQALDAGLFMGDVDPAVEAPGSRYADRSGPVIRATTELPHLGGVPITQVEVEAVGILGSISGPVIQPESAAFGVARSGWREEQVISAVRQETAGCLRTKSGIERWCFWWFHRIQS